MSDSCMVSRIYNRFRGADFRGEEISLVRSPDCLNVWRDYSEIEGIRTRPGMKLNTPFDSSVYGVFFFNNMMLVHSGDKLYSVQSGQTTKIYSGLNERASNAFIYNNVWYFQDGKNYLQHDGEKLSSVVGYVPTTSIANSPEGGGTIYEDVNLLSAGRINTFLADGRSKEYHLDTFNLDVSFRPIVKVNDKPVDEFTVDYEKGIITFEKTPPVPLTDGRDNVTVEFRKTVPGYAERIQRCTLLQVFDNRVFFSGNPDYPNTVWHCSLNDPTYFSDLDYYNEGLDTTAVKGLVAGNNALWVFREPSQANTTVFYHTPTLDADYGKIYPSQHSSVTTGCVGKAVNFNDDIVFFSERGMEGISGDITTEQVVAHRSSLVDRKLTAEDGYMNMILEEWGGYLLVITGEKIYLADSRAAFDFEGHSEYEWFYWDMGRNITCTRVQDGVLYLGASDGVYTLTDHTSDVESHWVTPKDKFKYPNMQKTTNKRGCLAEATGDVTVYVKTDKTDFELVEEYSGVTDHFTCRIKRKKFKDIQLKFESKTRFSLESVTLECFVGGYIKR